VLIYSQAETVGRRSTLSGLTTFSGYGSITTVQPYVPGSRSLNASEVSSKALGVPPF
jgi:hypothetical protein